MYFICRLLFNVSPLEVLVTRKENLYQNNLSFFENQSLTICNYHFNSSIYFYSTNVISSYDYGRLRDFAHLGNRKENILN